MASHQFRLDPATEHDVPVILRFIRELADYEKLAHEVVASEESLRASLFGPRPAAEAVIAYAGDEPAGFAVYFQTFSTFLGRPGIYLEDLYVTPSWRSHGLGRRLLAYVARVAVERGYGRMEWSVLDWNELALGVYRKIGARPMDEWTVQRLTGDALRSLAESAYGGSRFGVVNS
jgi:GNAT superfamily N-acetyltransferase